jgi:hypothetical protein
MNHEQPRAGFNRRQLTALGLASAFTSACAHAPRAEPTCNDAFYFCFPIFEFARTAWQAAAPSARYPEGRYNRLAHRTTLADHTARSVTTPNNDTVYSSMRLDLSQGGVEIDVPSVTDRYFSMALMNCFTDNFAYVGTRTTQGRGGRYLIAPPGWRGSTGVAPAQTIVSPTSDAWLLARILVDGEADLSEANAIQREFNVVQAPPPAPPRMRPITASDPENLLEVVNEMLERNRADPRVARAAAMLAPWGVRPGVRDAFAQLPADRREAWRGAIADSLHAMRAGFAAQGRSANGWNYPPADIGSQSASDQVRATVALSGLAALEREEATYARCDRDAAGAMLDGSHSYQFLIPRDVPARAFWSLSLYTVEADGRLFFAENLLRRYSLGNRSPNLAKQSDDSVRILIQNVQPQREAGNWLPAPPGPFALVFRFYMPSAPLLTGAWRLPAVERVAS